MVPISSCCSCIFVVIINKVTHGVVSVILCIRSILKMLDISASFPNYLYEPLAQPTATNFDLRNCVFSLLPMALGFSYLVTMDTQLP